LFIKAAALVNWTACNVKLPQKMKEKEKEMNRSIIFSDVNDVIGP